MRELLSNNSLFVGQLYEDKSLALRARDLIFFTTDLQTVNYYTTIHCYNPFLVYCRELAPGTVSLTCDRAQGDDSKHDSHYRADLFLK